MDLNIAIGATPTIELPFKEPSATEWIRAFRGLITRATNIKKEEILSHDDILPFSFAPLDQIRKDLAEAGYSTDEISKEIEALSELHQYAKKNLRNKKG